MTACMWKNLRLLGHRNVISCLHVKKSGVIGILGRCCGFPTSHLILKADLTCSHLTYQKEDVRWWNSLVDCPSGYRRDLNQPAGTVKPLKVVGSSALYEFKESLQYYREKDWSPMFWETLESKVLDEDTNFDKIWEAVCMNLLLSSRLVSGGISLLEYIQQKGRSPNIATLTTFISLCGQYGGKPYHSLVFHYYEELLKETELFDSHSCKKLIQGLCGTDRWKEAIPLLDMAKITQEPNASYYGPVAMAAFRENQTETALEMLDAMGNRCLTPQAETLLAFVEAVKNRLLTFEAFVYYLREYSWFPPTEVAESVADTFRRLSQGQKLKISWTRMTERGVCKACGYRAKQLELTENQFTELREKFLEKAVIGGDVFLKTSPAEMKKFLDFIDRTAPYDVVLDSLNIALGSGARKHLRKRVEMLHGVVDFFQVRRKKVLLLGKKHMESWFQTDVHPIHKKADCFFANDISEDDPFLLYATLFSGRHTVFVSNDEMRDHKYLLGRKLGETFKQWQRSRQIYFFGIHPTSNRLRFVMPKGFDTLAQEDEHGWHIPYENKKERVSFQHPNAWLCLRKRSVVQRS